MHIKNTIAAATLLLATTACSADSTEDNGPIAIALLAPHSGPNTLIGEEVANVMNIVLDEREGMVGGREVEIVLVDSASDPATAVENYEAALADPEHNIVAGFFNWHSDVALETMDVVADAGVPHFFPLGASGEINDKYLGNTARHAGWLKGWATPTKLGANYVTAIEDSIAAGALDLGDQGRTVAIYGEDTSWGRGFAEGMKTSLQAAGWTVVAEEYVEADGSDYSATATAFAAAEPRLVAGTIATGSVYTFVTQIRGTFDDDAQPLIVADGLGWNSDWYQALGDDSNGVVDQIPQFATQEAQDFASGYRDRFGSDASPSAGGLAYDYARFMFQVFETVDESGGTLDRESIKDVLVNQVASGDLDMTDGILMSRYVWNGDSAPDPVVGGDAFTFPVLQYSSGESRVVWPEALKASGANIE